MILLYLTRLTLPSEAGQRHRVASCTAHCLLRWALRELDVDPKCYPLCRTEEGKPYLAHTDLQISLSHSGQWAVCVISNSPVGVDVEQIRPISSGVWRRYLATRSDEPCPSAYEGILRWTRYEASLKRLGHPSPLPEGVEFTTFRTIPGYLLTVCGEGGVASLQFVSEAMLTEE